MLQSLAPKLKHQQAVPTTDRPPRTNKILYKNPAGGERAKPAGVINLASPSSPARLSTLQPIYLVQAEKSLSSALTLESSQQRPKLNTIRNGNNQAKQEIINLKARINKLREENERNRKRSLRSYAQIEKMLSTKYNYIEKKRNKSLSDQRKMLDHLDRIQTAQLARLKDQEAIKNSKEKSKKEKSAMGLTQRQIWSMESRAIREDKQRNQEINAEKARSIKEYEKEHRNYMSILGELSRVKARSNHDQKVREYTKQKQILNKTMRQLKKEEEELVELLKKEGEEWRQIEEEMEQMKVRAG